MCPSMWVTVPGTLAGQEREWISCAQEIRVGSHVEEAEQNHNELDRKEEILQADWAM